MQKKITPPEHVEICGVPVSTVDRSHVLRQMTRTIDSRKPGNFISITNTESMYHALRTGAHMDFVRKATYSLCDGVGVILADLVWGHRIRRYNGPILMLDCCEHGQAHGWRHFFYGGKAGVAEKLAACLKQQYPDLIVAGTFSPPFGDLSPEMDASVTANDQGRETGHRVGRAWAIEAGALDRPAS